MGKGSFSFCRFVSRRRPKKTVVMPPLPSLPQPPYRALIVVSPNNNNCLISVASNKHIDKGGYNKIIC